MVNPLKVQHTSSIRNLPILCALLVAGSPLFMGGNHVLTHVLYSAGIAFLLLYFSYQCAKKQCHYAPLTPDKNIRLIMGFCAVIILLNILQLALPPFGYAEKMWQLVPKSHAFYTLTPLVTFQRLLSFSVICATVVLAWQIGQSRRQSRIFLNVLCSCAALYAAYGLVSTITGHEWVLWREKRMYIGSLTSTFINRNHWADFIGIMGMVWVFSTLRVNVDKQITFHLRHMWWALCGFLYITTLFLSQSRAAVVLWVAVTMTLVLGRVLLSRSSASKRRVLMSFVVCFIVVCSFIAAPLINRFGGLKSDISLRKDMYDISLKAIETMPALGYGNGAFEDVFDAHRPYNYHMADRVDHAHNMPLEWLIELGYVGGVAIFLIILLLSITFIKAVFCHHGANYYAWIGLGILGFICLHSVVDFGVMMPGVYIPLAAILSICLAQVTPKQKAMRAPTKRMALCAVICLLSSFFSAKLHLMPLVTNAPLSPLKAHAMGYAYGQKQWASTPASARNDTWFNAVEFNVTQFLQTKPMHSEGWFLQAMLCYEQKRISCVEHALLNSYLVQPYHPWLGPKRVALAQWTSITRSAELSIMVAKEAVALKNR